MKLKPAISKMSKMNVKNGIIEKLLHLQSEPTEHTVGSRRLFEISRTDGNVFGYFSISV